MDWILVLNLPETTLIVETIHIFRRNTFCFSKTSRRVSGGSDRVSKRRFDSGKLSPKSKQVVIFCHEHYRDTLGLPWSMVPEWTLSKSYFEPFVESPKSQDWLKQRHMSEHQSQPVKQFHKNVFLLNWPFFRYWMFLENCSCSQWEFDQSSFSQI